MAAERGGTDQGAAAAEPSPLRGIESGFAKGAEASRPLRLPRSEDSGTAQ